MNSLSGNGRTLDPSLRWRAGTSPAPGLYPMGLMSLLATVAMLFASFTAAILMRRAGTDWIPVKLPSIVWGNTFVLILSSIAIEMARSGVRRGRVGMPVRALASASLLGVIFLMGQMVAWRLLAARGVFLPTNPHAAFFYMLSAVHAAHVLGGLAALAYTLKRAAQGAYTASQHMGLTHAAVYWHFVGAVWVYLLILLSTL